VSRDPSTRPITFKLNGSERSFEVDPEMPLMYALRDLAGLTGAKYGCGLGQCGSCSVLIDGERVASCDTPMAKVEGRQVVTVEGLADGDRLHPLQQAFIDEHGLQCGYCTPGFVIAAKALLDRNPEPSEADIKTALQDNLCRCGSHARIIAAVKRAAREMKR
jgi:aerobic-type carbon monoxide dehydrogenase small subunit (CoxS/CutS family)